MSVLGQVHRQARLGKGRERNKKRHSYFKGLATQRERDLKKRETPSTVPCHKHWLIRAIILPSTSQSSYTKITLEVYINNENPKAHPKLVNQSL